MLITCPSCAHAFELSDAAVGPEARVPCVRCGRVIVARADPPEADGAVANPSATAPFRALGGEVTAVGVRAGLAFPPGRRVSLAILTGPRKGEVVRLEKPRIVLGRAGGSADVNVDDPEMSRAHAALECYGRRMVVHDLGSRNGTFVDEQKVERRELEDKAEFRLGSTRFMVIVANQD